MIELGEAEGDNSVVAEAEAALKALKKDVARRELEVDCREERREILALAVAAGDQHDLPGRAFERGQRRGDRRALGVVDPEHAATASTTRCIRCGRPSKVVRAASTRWSILATVETSASAARAFQCIVAPDQPQVGRRDEQRAAAGEPRAAVRDQPPRFLRLRHAGAEGVDQPAPEIASPSERGSSRFSTCIPPLRKIRAFAAA